MYYRWVVASVREFMLFTRFIYEESIGYVICFSKGYRLAWGSFSR